MDAHANFAYGTVLTAPSPATTGTSLVLNSGQGALFPAPPFNVVVWPVSDAFPHAATAEIVRVTALSGDTFSTISRHQEGTSARTIVVGDQVALAVTNKVLTDIESAATGSLQPANNLNDVASVSSARSSLGLGTAATHPAGDFLLTANNLSDVVAATARTNLGLGTAATHASGDFLLAANNLSDVTAATARSNLGLGSLATKSTVASADITDGTIVDADVSASAAIAATKVAGTAVTQADTGTVTSTMILDGTVAVGDMTAAALERAFLLGKAGAIAVTETDAADFPFVVPFNCTIVRMKVTLKSAATGAMVVQLRSAAATITTLPTYSNVTSVTCTFTNTYVLATASGFSTNLGEGDMLNFSVSTGSGTNLAVEVIVKLR